jgi:deoxycytidine triphosphate deaminase
MNGPWKDWIPGVLCKRQVEELCEVYIEGVEDVTNAVGYSSIDLTLSDEGYEMITGSIKPAGIDYTIAILENRDYARRIDGDQDGIFTLSTGKTYVFRLNEMLDKLQGSSVYGQATAKSSVGRVDVLARLIVDKMFHYEYFVPEKLPERHVKMFLEISPITFSVRVKKGISLSQLRLFYGRLEDSEKGGAELCSSVLSREDKIISEPDLSVDLSEINICGEGVSAFAAKKQERPVDLWKHDNKADRPNPADYWECMHVDVRNRLPIEKDRFYIIRSKERLSVPEGIAVYAKAMDETIGEMRVHYAGFAHPFFGKNRRTSPAGTPLMFEVREHSFPISLRDDEKLARLEFFRMSKDCELSQPRGDVEEESVEEDDYNEQELQLSKFFRDWGDSG